MTIKKIKDKTNMQDVKERAMAKSLREIANVSVNGEKVVYIAGKVTGLGRLEVLANFMRAENALRALGYGTINPVRLVHPDANWVDAMRICLSFLPHADYIYLMDNWTDSDGATFEAMVAEKLKIGVIEL